MNPSSWFGAGADSRLQVLWDDGERVFCRRSREAGDGDAMLAVVPASDPRRRAASIASRMNTD